MKKKDYIYDNGKIRNCVANIIQIIIVILLMPLFAHFTLKNAIFGEGPLAFEEEKQEQEEDQCKIEKS